MEYLVILTAFVYLSLKNCISAQLSISETLVIKTFCALNSVSVDCGTNNVIALQQIQYGYNFDRCNNVCCQSKESGDCLVNVTDSTSFKRLCSGLQSCNPPVVSSLDFCLFGRQTASYVLIEYYCIPKSRIISFCSSNTITSAGEPLYLTNPGYPGATIGTHSCSCSFEAQSCLSGTSSFIIDADLYSDPNNCLQSLRLLDNNDTLIESIQCENYYNGYVKQNNLLSNYIKVNFDSNSTQNLEGYVFIGFIASEYGVPFSLTCSSISATWCIDCGIPNNITNGIVALDTPNKLIFNSRATVTCNPGFTADTSKIVCKQRGIWESVSCNPTAQLLLGETLINKTFCELSNVSIDCGTHSVIALQQVQYGYNFTRCNTMCCQFKEIGDCVIPVTDTVAFKRICSGKSSCYPPVVSSHVFCSFDRQVASYVYVEYYCILRSRIASVCSNNTITSAGEPLYLTNPGYPGATIGTRSCSCSFEAQSCSSGTSHFIIDADLYSEPSTCNQSVLITDVDGVLRESIKCENYYTTFVTHTNLMSNYYRIYFESNSIQNLEGYLFMGFTASEPSVAISLTCSKQPATWCTDVTTMSTDRSESGIAGLLAGVVVGSVLGTLAIVAAVYFIRRCLRNSQPTMTTRTSELEENDTYNNVSDVDSFTRDVGVPNVYESLNNAGSDQHYQELQASEQTESQNGYQNLQLQNIARN